MKFWLHLKTICIHKWYVFLACKDLGITWRGIKHDLSKFSPIEFLPGVKYFQGNRSPIAAEKEEKGYSLGWLHHKSHNTHHWEYWLDFNDKGIYPIEIPYYDMLELIADRVGASKAYNRKNWDERIPLKYWNDNRDKVIIHPKTAAFIGTSLEFITIGGWDNYVEYIKRQGKEI